MILHRCLEAYFGFVEWSRIFFFKQKAAYEFSAFLVGSEMWIRGSSPPIAMPAATVTACCSVIPTSKNRSGNRSWKGIKPGGPGIAGVIGTMR